MVKLTPLEKMATERTSAGILTQEFGKKDGIGIHIYHISLNQININLHIYVYMV